MSVRLEHVQEDATQSQYYSTSSHPDSSFKKGDEGISEYMSYYATFSSIGYTYMMLVFTWLTVFYFVVGSHPTRQNPSYEFSDASSN